MSEASSPRPPLRPLLAALLQCLPLLGLGGCSALWTVVPVGRFFNEASAPAFWAFMGLASVCAVASLCWGLGYLYLGRRERLGCGLLLLGPLFVLWSYGYVFDGFLLARSEADEAIRRRAMLMTAGLVALPLLLMAWDAWRQARQPAATE